MAVRIADYLELACSIVVVQSNNAIDRIVRGRVEFQDEHARGRARQALADRFWVDLQLHVAAAPLGHRSGKRDGDRPGRGIARRGDEEVRIDTPRARGDDSEPTGRQVGFLIVDPGVGAGLVQQGRIEIPAPRPHRVEVRVRGNPVKGFEDYRRAALGRRIFHGQAARDLDGRPIIRRVDDQSDGGQRRGRRRRLMVHHCGEPGDVAPLRRGPEVTLVRISFEVAEQDVGGPGRSAHRLPAVVGAAHRILVEQARVPAPRGLGAVRPGARQRPPGQCLHEGVALRRVRPLRGIERETPPPRLRHPLVYRRAASDQPHCRDAQFLEPRSRIAIDVGEAGEAGAVPARQVGEHVGAVGIAHPTSPPFTMRRK